MKKQVVGVVLLLCISFQAIGRDECKILNPGRSSTDQYACPELPERQFSKLVFTSPKIEQHATTSSTREASLKPVSQSWLSKVLFGKILQHDDFVFDIDTRENEIEIRPKSGFVGFVMKDDLQIGVGGQSYQQVRNTLMNRGQRAIDNDEKPLLETAIAGQYTVHFYGVGHCIKTGRPMYSPRAGSLTLTVNSHRDKSSDQIIFDVMVAKTNTDGTIETKRRNIAYPTFEKCSIHPYHVAAIAQKPGESSEEWNLRSLKDRKCLGSPIIYESGPGEK